MATSMDDKKIKTLIQSVRSYEISWRVSKLKWKGGKQLEVRNFQEELKWKGDNSHKTIMFFFISLLKYIQISLRFVLYIKCPNMNLTKLILNSLWDILFASDGKYEIKKRKKCFNLKFLHSHNSK